MEIPRFNVFLESIGKPRLNFPPDRIPTEKFFLAIVRYEVLKLF